MGWKFIVKFSSKTPKHGPSDVFRGTSNDVHIVQDIEALSRRLDALERFCRPGEDALQEQNPCFFVNVSGDVTNQKNSLNVEGIIISNQHFMGIPTNQ